MSGPKVVRIVTREEIEVICRRHIATVAVTVQEAIGRARRCGKLDDALEKSLLSRVTMLEELFARSEWMTIQKQAPQTLVFLQAEGERLEKVATQEAALKRTRRRRSIDAARSVAAALKASGIFVEPALERAAKGRISSLEDVDRIVAAGLAAIPVGKQTKEDLAGQAALAARLSTGETSRSVSELVIAQQPGTAADQRLDTLIAELHVLGTAAADLVERADNIMLEGDANRRRLLTDSLIMDAAAQVAALRKREAIDTRLRQAAASLQQVDTAEGISLRNRLDGSLGSVDEMAAAALVDEAAGVVDAHGRALAAASRRKAVLSGLSTLGYEIRDTMGSAWERDGRLIVRKPGMTDYGVELGAPADAARFQVRLVGAASPEMPRDARRDADQEVMWCGEFDRLRADLSARGDELVLEKAVEAGTMPLRSVEMHESRASETTVMNAAPVSKARTV